MASAAGPSTRSYAVDYSAEEARVRDMYARMSMLDIEELEASSESSQLSDAQLARQLFAEEARAAMTFENDRAVAQSLQEAEPTTAEGAARDAGTATARLRAPTTSGTQSGTASINAGAGTREAAQTPKWWSSMRAYFTSILSSSSSSSPPPPATATAEKVGRGAGSAKAPDRPTGHDCVVCQEPIMNVEIRAPCGHYYDKTCALQLFEASTRDESLHPPRCCRQPIPLRIVQFHMSNELAKLFDEKSREFGTLKRVYCSNPTCSHFLGEQIDKSVIYTCPKPSCSVRTCGRCKARMTSGTISHICKEDGADQDVLNMGDREGWARCPGCDALIELNLGCYHMTCRCKTEFCYLCKARWKNCQCPQWDERHLLIAAEERVDRELGAPRRPGRVEDAPAVARLPQVRPAAAAQRQPPVQLNPVRPAGPVRVAAQQPAAVARPVPVVTPPRLDPYGSVERRTQDRPQQFDARADPRLAAQPRVAELAQITATRREGQGARGTDAKGPTGTRAEGMQSLTRRERMIREAVEELRVNHDCQHDRWRYRPGGGVCQTCYNRLPSYLFRCAGCQTLACNRCRRNRL